VVACSFCSYLAIVLTSSKWDSKSILILTYCRRSTHAAVLRPSSVSFSCTISPVILLSYNRIIQIAPFLRRISRTQCLIHNSNVEVSWALNGCNLNILLKEVHNILPAYDGSDDGNPFTGNGIALTTVYTTNMS